MQITLEDLDYQRRAIQTVVGVLKGQVKNTFDNSNLFGIQANITDLSPEKLLENKKAPRLSPHRLRAAQGIQPHQVHHPRALRRHQGRRAPVFSGLQEAAG
jgi:restriction endonuclease